MEQPLYSGQGPASNFANRYLYIGRRYQASKVEDEESVKHVCLCKGGRVQEVVRAERDGLGRFSAPDAD